MKYIIFDHLDMHLFGDNLQHSDVAALIGGNATSAGFVNMQTLECYGESMSLGLSARGTDTHLLRCLSKPLGGTV